MIADGREGAPGQGKIAHHAEELRMGALDGQTAGVVAHIRDETLKLAALEEEAVVITWGPKAPRKPALPAASGGAQKAERSEALCQHC